MTAPPAFPALPGLGWSVHKRPSFSTRVANHVSGREVRAALYAFTLYEFELTFDGLDSNGTYVGLTANSLQSLMGFYLNVQGQFGTFLYADPSDDIVTGQLLGHGDGATTSFTCLRALGSFAEPVGWVTSLTNVYLNGVAQPSSTYSLTQPNTLVFNSAPGVGVELSADFSYAFVCRFLEDAEDFEEFISGLWQVKSLKFRSVKP
jgi:hypothetical protein